MRVRKMAVNKFRRIDREVSSMTSAFHSASALYDTQPVSVGSTLADRQRIPNRISQDVVARSEGDELSCFHDGEQFHDGYGARPVRDDDGNAAALADIGDRGGHRSLAFGVEIGIR